MSDWRSHDAAQPFAQKRKRELDSGKVVSYGHRYDATKHEREQEVRDEHGRRRLHGAFTGGFTAGYFGTVGSKEGWAPSSFVSSRAQRAQVSSNVMDFMDAEDIADLEETMDFRAAREAQNQPAPIEQEEQLRTHEESDIVEILPKQVAIDARQKRQSQAGGMSTVSLMQEQDDDFDGYDIGPKITYDKTLAKQKKVKPKAATAVHTFQSSKIAKAKVAQRQALLNDLDGATIVQEAVTESSRLPEEDTTDATIKQTSAYQSTAKKQLSASQSGPREAIAASSNVPPWRQKPSTQGALTASRAGPPLEMSSAKAALTSTFDPYAQNPQKSQRYRAYLSQEAVVSVPEHRNLASLAPDVFESELAEFHRAALMFGSSAGAMASRFTSATGQTQTDVPEVHVAFETQIEAAHAGRFGHRTRVIESWFPTRLLCKRFGVPDPHPVGKASAAVDTYESRAEVQLERRMQIEQLMQGPAPASPEVEASPEILKSSTMKKSGERQQASKAFQELFKDDSYDD